jgi:hypothetical protein
MYFPERRKYFRCAGNIIIRYIERAIRHPENRFRCIAKENKKKNLNRSNKKYILTVGKI